MKISDIDDNRAARDVRETIESGASQLGMDTYSVNNPNGALVRRFGMCGKCTCMQYASTEFEVVVARCSRFEIALHESKLVRDCTEFCARGQMSLNDMIGIAWIVDGEGPPNQIGFIEAEEE